MIIHLSQSGQEFKAFVIYNFRQFKNVIIVRLLKPSRTDKDDLVLFYDVLDNRWKEVCHLEQGDPIFFQQILSRLSRVFIEAQKNLNDNAA
jgi:hypothetical protein